MDPRNHRIYVTQHACTRYAEYNPLNARVRDLLHALDLATEVDEATAFRLSNGDPTHPAHGSGQHHFYLSRDGRGLFIVKPDAKRRGRWVMPTYLRLPQDQRRKREIQSILCEGSVTINTNNSEPRT